MHIISRQIVLCLTNTTRNTNCHPRLNKLEWMKNIIFIYPVMTFRFRIYSFSRHTYELTCRWKKKKQIYGHLHNACVTHFFILSYVIMYYRVFCWIYIYEYFDVHHYKLAKFRNISIAFTFGVFSSQEFHELAFSSHMS